MKFRIPNYVMIIKLLSPDWRIVWQNLVKYIEAVTGDMISHGSCSNMLPRKLLALTLWGYSPG